MKLNLKELPVEVSPDGTIENRDVRTQMGNLLWNFSQDIALSDVGREIYRSEGEIEVSDVYREGIEDLVKRSTFFAPVKRAILKQLNTNP